MSLRYFESQANGVVFATLETGDLLLESLRELVHQADIPTGVLMTGIGSLSKGHIHTVQSNDHPVKELFLDIPGPLEVTNFNGIIANYEPHVHITMMDPERRFYGGHLEDGCQILTLAEFSILRIPDVRLFRHLIPERSMYKLLDQENEPGKMKGSPIM